MVVMKCCTVSATATAALEELPIGLPCSIVAGMPEWISRLAAMGHCMLYVAMNRSTSGTCAPSAGGGGAGGGEGRRRQ
jgi:hypothetical protein